MSKPTVMLHDVSQFCFHPGINISVENCTCQSLKLHPNPDYRLVVDYFCKDGAPTASGVEYFVYELPYDNVRFSVYLNKC